MNTDSVQIRDATSQDKLQCLDFCKNTFSWGDYVKEAWDYWFQEPNSRLLVAQCQLTKVPVAFCHVVFLSNTVAWIEGIRVNPSYRKNGIARKLVHTSEKLANEKRCVCCYMLVASSNKPSLSLAKKSGYTVSQKWYYYNMVNLTEKPQKPGPVTTFSAAKNVSEAAHTIKGRDNTFFVKSWRWLPLQDTLLEPFVQSGRVLVSQTHMQSFAILTESKRDKTRVLVTAYPESDEASFDLLEFLKQLFGTKYTQIEILSKNLLPSSLALERETEFLLLRKDLTH